MEATLTFLGSGTSMGVPTLGCGCAVCRSALPEAVQAEPRNRRTRPSLRLVYNGRVVLIDTGPDFHVQAVREGIGHVDAVLYTHGHADHIMGFDDLRPLSFQLEGGLPIYADEPTMLTLRRVFDYTFRKQGRYQNCAEVTLHPIDPAPGAGFDLFGACFRRIPIRHGEQVISGYRFGQAAYLTDMSEIPDESLPLLEGLDLLILDALRRRPHPSHSHLAHSIACVERLRPRRAYFTHICHDLDHVAVEAELPDGIHLAYDGLQLQFEIA
jgi:phosphoribosyl 1,2-cyclic phosphate phosphodiesterase